LQEKLVEPVPQGLLEDARTARDFADVRTNLHDEFGHPDQVFVSGMDRVFDGFPSQRRQPSPHGKATPLIKIFHNPQT
jgi:hypothetical protein